MSIRYGTPRQNICRHHGLIFAGLRGSGQDSHRVAKDMFPFLPDRENANPEVGRRTGQGERKKVQLGFIFQQGDRSLHPVRLAFYGPDKTTIIDALDKKTKPSLCGGFARFDPKITSWRISF
jgi:hypothetical protein